MRERKDYLERLRNHESLSTGELCAMIGRLSVPAILAQISTIIMQYIDASMVGSLGAGSSAAIGLVSSTTWLLGGIAMAVGMGFTVQCAQQIGAGDRAGAQNLVQQGMLFTILFSLAVGALGCLAARSLPAWLGGSQEIRADAASYFLVFALFFTIDRVNFLGGSFLQATGNMRVPGMLHIMMCVLDVIFNALLIFPGTRIAGLQLPGLGLGVTGAALGTGLAKLCSMTIMLYFLYRRSPILDMKNRGKMRIRADQIRKSLVIALPVAVENMILNTAQIASTRIVAPLGTAAVAANSLSVTAESLCYMPGFGIASAATAVIGQSVGADRRDLTKRIGWISTGLGIAVMSLSGVLLYAGAPLMIRFFSPDPQVIALGTRCLRIEAFAEPMFAASIVAAGVMRGGGDTLIPACLSLLSMWCVRIPLSLLLAPRLGLPGVWLAMCIELNVRGILFLLRQKQGRFAA